ncbi:MAG: hypothetical protein WC971_04465 [Coriobacteriia bacterium]
MPAVTDIEVVRRGHLAEKVVFVDGLPGCGKTMLSPIVAAMPRVELLTYAYAIEHVCDLHSLGKITLDAAAAMVGLQTDLRLYDTMMSRETNFRPRDLSSAWRAPRRWRYFERLFAAGDEAVPARIRDERPILHLTTHKLLAFAEPVFAALGERAVLLEVVRHPLYMLKQQALNMASLVADPRDFDVYVAHGDGGEVPCYTVGWEDLFARSNETERAIHAVDRLTALTEETKATLKARYGARIVTIPFERFVVEPAPYLAEIEDALGTRSDEVTLRMLRKQNVPRARWGEGIRLDIYERCGWEPPAQGATEADELEVRRRFAALTAGPEAMAALDRCCDMYEETYLGGRMRDGEHYA